MILLTSDMLERSLTRSLLDWQDKPARKPILINGARQTGKTFLVKNIFANSNKFRRSFYLDFERDPTLEMLFDDNLSPKSVIDNIGLRFGEPVDVSNDLVIFDEIGSCERALQSLKYVAEDFPHAFFIATGSNIGLLQSFPVGKVDILDLYPLTYEEFLIASSSPVVIDAYHNYLNSSEAHKQFWSTFLDYCYVGGMPEAVTHWNSRNNALVERVNSVKQVHRNLIESHSYDFGKYAGIQSAHHIESVFRNVPLQLRKNIDGSVKRFRFRDTIQNKKRYTELQGPIDWLSKAKLVSKNYPITQQPVPPLHSHIKENVFKLFLFDIGLLGYLTGMSYEDHRCQTTIFKGFIAENFVQNELIAKGLNHTYSWEQNQAEIEFVIRNSRGDVIPVEVKSGARTQAKSLTSYIKRYNPDLAVKLIAARGGTHGILKTVPLYYASTILD